MSNAHFMRPARRSLSVFNFYPGQPACSLPDQTKFHGARG